MLSTERLITVRKGTSKINAPIVLYRGDKNIEVKFQINNNPFMADSAVKYGQLIIKLPEAGIVIFSTINKFDEEVVSFILPEDMMDEIVEVGLYTIQLRFYNEDKTSVATLPEIAQALDIREPIAIQGQQPVSYNPITATITLDPSMFSYNEETKTFTISSMSYNEQTKTINI